MNMYLILAYITGTIIVSVSLFNFAFKSRTVSLILKAVIDFVAIFNLLFSMLATENNAILASLVATGIGLCRDIVFLFRNKSKYMDHIAWPIGFCVIFACSLFFTYKTPISLLPAIGSLFSTMTLYSKKPIVTKTGAIICTSLYIIYFSILLPSSDSLTLFSLLSYCTSFLGATFGLIKILSHQKKESKEKKV